MGQETESMLDPRLTERLTAKEFGALSNWCENVECSIRFVQWLGGGKTEAKLAVVIINDGHHLRKSVLKYCPSRNTISRDFRAFRRASISGPKGFAKKHLVGIDPAADTPIPNGSDGLFLLMDWRIGGRYNYDTMSTLLDRDVLGTACEVVVTSTLMEWNSVKHMDRMRPTELAAVEFLREIVGEKCESGGSIRTAAERLGTPCSESYLTVSGPLLPNPIAAAAAGEWISGTSVLGFRGNAHGDLHTDNILLPQPRNSKISDVDFERYILIDLSTFSDRRLVLVDPAHLLLSIIARRLPEVSSRGKDRLFQMVLDPEHGESGGIPVELVRVANGIQRAGIAFAESGNLYDEWRAESLLATVGCALLFVGRDIEDDSRRWFLQLAGIAIDAFREIARQGDGENRDGGRSSTAIQDTYPSTSQPIVTAPEKPQHKSTNEPISESDTAAVLQPVVVADRANSVSDLEKPSANIGSVDDALRVLRGLLVEACPEPDEAQLVVQDANIGYGIPFSKTAPDVFWNKVLRAAHISWRMESLFKAVDSRFGENPAWSNAKRSYRSARASLLGRPDKSELSVDRTGADISLYSRLPQRVKMALAAIVPGVFSDRRLATSAIEDADDALDDLDGLINALEFRARAQTSDPPTRASLNQIADRIRNRRSHLKDVLSSLRQPGRFDRTTMLCGEIVLHASELESDLMRALPLVT